MRLKPGSLERVRAWAAELTNRRDEVMVTLRDETVRVESAFLESTAAGDFLVYYMRTDDEEQSRRAARSSTHAIDAYHRDFMDAVVAERLPLEVLVDFDRSRE
jgi:hypothetical protein